MIKRMRDKIITKKIIGSNRFREKALASKNIDLKLGVKTRIDWCLSTGLPSVDMLSARDKDGMLGIPCGSIVTICGNASQGKTSLSLEIIKSAQAEDPLGRREPMECIHQETEGLLSAELMMDRGIETDTMLENDPQSLEEAFDTSIHLLKIARDEGKHLLLILDSLSAMPTISEVDSKTLTKAGQPGRHARITSQAFRVLPKLLKQTKSIYLIVAQSKQDIMGGPFASKTFIAENPLLFHSGIVYQIARTSWIKRKDQNCGMNCKITIRKSKVGIPMRFADKIVLDFENGFDKMLSLHEALEMKGLVKRDGMSYIVKIKTKSGKQIRYKGRDGIKNLSPKIIAGLQKMITR